MDVLCTADLCPVILNATCVFYEGNTLLYTGITTNDNLQTALQKIDAKFGDAMVGYTFTNGVFQSAAGAPVGLGGNLTANTTIGGNFTLTFAGNVQAAKHITTGGTASQFVKGDGTLDSTAYQAAGNYITALTGDVIANGPGSVAASLAVVNSNPGTYGSSTRIPIVTVDTKGRVTALTTTAISVPSGSLSFVGDVYGSGTTGSQTTLTLTNVNSNVYTNNTFLKFKVNAKGLVTGAAPITNVDIEGVLGYVPTPETRKLSINGVQHDLQSDIYWTIATGVGSVTATAPLSSTGGANPNISITKADATTDGYLDNVDWVTFNAKQAALNGTGLVRMSGTTVTYDNTAYTPQSRTLTINGVTFDLSANRSWTITSMIYPAAGIAVSTGTAWGTSIVDNSTNWNTAYAERISSASAPLSIASNAISISQASGSSNGYLSSGDWTTFNNKEGSITQGTTSQYWRGDKSWQTLDTTAVTEGSNLYYTDGRVRAALSVSAPLTYSSTTGEFGITKADASTDGYLSSTDWNTFNNKQPADHYITDLTGEATAAGPGIATVTLSTPAVTGKVLTGVNITGGTIVATDTILQAFGKVQNQINGLIGGTIYQGVWNAATNTPTLTSGVGTDGHYYITNVAGNTNLDGITDWHVGDWAIFHDGAWQQVDNTDAVISVNGETGAVSLVSSDIPEGATNLYFTNTRARQAISLTTTGSSGAATYNDGTGVLNIPNYNPDLSGYVPTTRTLTINGTAFDLTANRSWSVGTVTSVAQLTIGTTGTDITSSVATGTTTPVITLNIPTASATNRGALSSTDWSTFNSKQPALGYTPVPQTRTLTINGTAYDLSADRSWTISTYSLPIATASVLGGVKIGGGVSIDAGGVISVSTNYQAPLSGTGFVKSTAGVISYDTNTYLTTTSAAATYLPLAGGTMSGILYTTYNTATGLSNLGFNTAKTVIGGYHVQNGAGPGNDNSNQAAITFQGGTASEAQAGIYVINNNSYGTSMGFATTNSYATGPQLFMTATNGGVVNFPRATPTVQGNAMLHAGNYNSYSPTLTGGGASGTWAISISGNAASATNATNATFASNASGGFTNTGGHGSSFIQNELPAANNGAATGRVVLRQWCSEPGVTWDWAGFGYNVTNDGGSPSGFGRWNTSFGQAYMRFATNGDWYFYNTTSGGVRTTSMSFSSTGNASFGGKISNGSVWINNGVDFNSYNENIRLFAAPNGVSVIAFNASGIAGNPPGGSILGFDDRLEFRKGGDAWQLRIYSGSVNVANSLLAGGDVRGNDVYTTGGWFRNHTNNSGIYWANTGWHLYPKNASDFYFHSGTTDASIQFQRNGTNANYIHNASDNAIGFLSTGRSWILRVDNGGSTQVYGDLTVGSSGASNIFMTDTDEGTRQIHCNSNRIGFLTQSGSWGSWCDDDGGWQSAASISAGGQMYSSSWFYSNGNAGWYNNTYGQGLRQSKGNVSYGNVIVHGENFNGWSGYNTNNSTITAFMQNSSGTHGFYQENNAGWTAFWNSGFACWGLGTDATDPGYSLHIIKYGGSNQGWIIWSDRRIKENIKTIDNALDKVLSLRGVYYNKIDDPNKERCVGYIAQEVIEVVPELVVYSEELDMYNMNYGPMVAMLTEAIKEQQAQIEELKQQVQTLLNHINNGI